MRKEPLIGALVGAIVVGYFTSTEPALLMCLILGGIFLAFALQMLVVAGKQVSEDQQSSPAAVPSNSARVLAYAAASVAVAQTLVSMWMLVLAGNLFSFFGVLCGICFTVVAVRTVKAMSGKSSRIPVSLNL
ncbi:hypothetical protein [uncultured Arthrobacter sp.]|uniref:hypothetical protein n=1 Tax=uncultured Arthrobacter sp. TaxID=114050 RepID=UPI0026389117|nr:hypothetical protein [uncultured Arthrobacter sp.]